MEIRVSLPTAKEARQLFDSLKELISHKLLEAGGGTINVDHYQSDGEMVVGESTTSEIDA